MAETIEYNAEDGPPVAAGKALVVRRSGRQGGRNRDHLIGDLAEYLGGYLGLDEIWNGYEITLDSAFCLKLATNLVDEGFIKPRPSSPPADLLWPTIR